MKGRIGRLLLVAAIALGSVAIAAPTSARPGDVHTRGDCSSITEWRMRGRIAHGNVKVRYVIDSEIPGITWLVEIAANGTTIFSGSVVTDSNGDLEIRVRKRDQSGQDVFTASSINTFTGEQCGGSLTI
jgi:hypothetical protein